MNINFTTAHNSWKLRTFNKPQICPLFFQIGNQKQWAKNAQHNAVLQWTLHPFLIHHLSWESETWCVPSVLVWWKALCGTRDSAEVVSTAHWFHLWWQPFRLFRASEWHLNKTKNRRCGLVYTTLQQKKQCHLWNFITPKTHLNSHLETQWNNLLWTSSSVFCSSNMQSQSLGWSHGGVRDCKRRRNKCRINI